MYVLFFLPVYEVSGTSNFIIICVSKTDLASVNGEPFPGRVTVGLDAMEPCEVVTVLFYPNVVGIAGVSKVLAGFGRWDSNAGVKSFAISMSTGGACGRGRTRH